MGIGLRLLVLCGLVSFCISCDPTIDYPPATSSRLRIGFLPVDSSQQVNIYLDSVLVGEALTDVWWSERFIGDQNTHRLIVEAPGGEFSRVYDSTVWLVPYNTYTYVVSGEGMTFWGKLLTDTLEASSQVACLRAVSMQRGDEVRFLGEVARAIVFESILVYGGVSAYRPLPELELLRAALFHTSDGGYACDTIASPRLVAGHVYTVYAFGWNKYCDPPKRIRCVLVEDELP